MSGFDLFVLALWLAPAALVALSSWSSCRVERWVWAETVRTWEGRAKRAEEEVGLWRVAAMRKAGRRETRQ